jgi:hypothetical protein
VWVQTYAPFFRLYGVFIMTDMEKLDYTLEDTQRKTIHKKHYNQALEDETLEDVIEPKIGIWHWLMSFFKSDKRIGELNGHWAFLFKFILLVLLFVIPTIGTWGMWVTNEVINAKYHAIQTSAYGDRITKLEEASLKESVVLNHVSNQLTKIESIVTAISPPDLTRRIERIEKTADDNNTRLNTLDKNNSEQHANLLITLEQIKVKVESLK